MINTYKSHLKETFKLAILVSIGQLGHIMMGVVDSLMVGRVGADSLAASSLAGGIFFLLLVVGIGINTAVTTLTSIKIGEKKIGECGEILNNAFIVNIVSSFILFILIFFSSYFFVEMGQPLDVSIKAGSYLRIISFSVFPFMIFQMLKQFSEGVSDVKPPMIFALLANVLNIFMNWILIYGNLGFDALGLDGAGFSTLINRTFMGIGLCLYFYYNRDYEQYNIFIKIRNVNRIVIKKILKIGIPSGLQYVFEVAAFTFSAIMVGWLGSNYLASHHIALNLATVSYMLILGIATAGNIRVGNYYGQKNIVELKKAGKTAIFLGVSIMSLFAVLFFIFRTYIPWFYIDDINVINTTASLLIIAGFFQIFDGMQAVTAGVLRGIMDVKKPMFIILGAYWIVGIPSGYILAFNYELNAFGVWIGFLIGLIIIGLSLLIRFYNKTNKLKFND